jgi:hypothetical protein
MISLNFYHYKGEKKSNHPKKSKKIRKNQKITGQNAFLKFQVRMLNFPQLYIVRKVSEIKTLKNNSFSW